LCHRDHVPYDSSISIISRPTSRLLSFALCLEWINALEYTPEAGCLEWSYRHASVNTTTPIIDRKHMHFEACWKYGHDIGYDMRIINSRPCNLLNKIQNVFINGKQVKTYKITQTFPWFPQFYATVA